MPYRAKRRYATRRPRRKAVVPKRTQKIRRMAGQKPITWAETIARGAGPVAKLASSIATIAGLVNSEAKYIDTNFASVVVDNTGQQGYMLNDCAEGDDVGQRNGRFILDKGCSYKIRFLHDSTSVNSAIGYVWVYIKDQAQVNLVTASIQWTDVFNTVDPQALINKNVADNYVIIKRGMLMLDNQGNPQRQLNGYINLKGLHTKYNATTTGQIQKGGLAFIVVSDHAAASQPPHMNGNIRFLFHDN